ncbi:MAG: hypothetical protein A2017_12815 [Lentisphaerae bacterium GWF2_44_16]|nr:MAG: hypothetical protein A2017_12815 [Lentisphaerae bacterium GWF2_44_16]
MYIKGPSNIYSTTVYEQPDNELLVNTFYARPSDKYIASFKQAVSFPSEIINEVNDDSTATSASYSLNLSKAVTSYLASTADGTDDTTGSVDPVSDSNNISNGTEYESVSYNRTAYENTVAALDNRMFYALEVQSANLQNSTVANMLASISLISESIRKARQTVNTSSVEDVNSEEQTAVSSENKQLQNAEIGQTGTASLTSAQTVQQEETQDAQYNENIIDAVTVAPPEGNGASANPYGINWASTQSMTAQTPQQEQVEDTQFNENIVNAVTVEPPKNVDDTENVNQANWISNMMADVTAIENADNAEESSDSSQ